MNQHLRPAMPNRHMSLYKDVPNAFDALSPLLGLPRGAAKGGVPRTQRIVMDVFDQGATVSESPREIRHAFVRKVYLILLAQILVACIAAGAIGNSPAATAWLAHHAWAACVPLAGALATLRALRQQRHSRRARPVLFCAFALLGPGALGLAVAAFRMRVLAKALMLALSVVLCLVQLTFQTAFDVASVAPWYLALAVALATSAALGVVLPAGNVLKEINALALALGFAAYVLADTLELSRRVSPDQVVMGAISLNVDFIDRLLRKAGLAKGANGN